jgi:hypothetical protein
MIRYKLRIWRLVLGLRQWLNQGYIQWEGYQEVPRTLVNLSSNPDQSHPQLLLLGDHYFERSVLQAPEDQASKTTMDQSKATLPTRLATVQKSSRCLCNQMLRSICMTLITVVGRQ